MRSVFRCWMSTVNMLKSIWTWSLCDRLPSQKVGKQHRLERRLSKKAFIFWAVTRRCED